MTDPQQALTWSVLLARWTEFAASAVALPTDGEGGRMRRAVPMVIGLQAVTFALAEAAGLPRDERAVAIDRATVLIGQYEAGLRTIWAGETLPAQLNECAADARAALGLLEQVHHEGGAGQPGEV